MANTEKKEFGINSFVVRIIGVITMIIGSIGYMKGYGYDWLEAFGWTSFTIFAFLLVEGIFNTSDNVLYLRRFLLFAVISELLYDYFRFKRLIMWHYNSAIATLFVGLIVVMIVSLLKKRFENIVINMLAIAVLGFAAYSFTNRYNFDFGGYGIIIILMFYVAHEVTYTKLTELIVLIYVGFYMSSDILKYVTVGGLQYPIVSQLYCLIALPFIWLYNGKRGPNALGLQIAQYAVYPVFLGALILVKYFLN